MTEATNWIAFYAIPLGSMSPLYPYALRWSVGCCRLVITLQYLHIGQCWGYSVDLILSPQLSQYPIVKSILRQNHS